MTLDEIFEHWTKDCKIDETELGKESAKTAYIHNKYLKMYVAERRLLTQYTQMQKKLFLQIRDYYLGYCDQAMLKTMNRKPFLKTVLKTEVNIYIDADDDMIKANIKTANQKDKVECLEKIIKRIEGRQFELNTQVNWNKFINGQG
jgi:hypothetical protein